MLIQERTTPIADMTVDTFSNFSSNHITFIGKFSASLSLLRQEFSLMGLNVYRVTVFPILIRDQLTHILATKN
jgi:hypothetical protein